MVVARTRKLSFGHAFNRRLEDVDNNLVTTLGYENVTFPYLVLISGLVLASIHAMVEWLWNRIKNRQLYSHNFGQKVAEKNTSERGHWFDIKN